MEYFNLGIFVIPRVYIIRKYGSQSQAFFSYFIDFSTPYNKIDLSKSHPVILVWRTFKNHTNSFVSGRIGGFYQNKFCRLCKILNCCLPLKPTHSYLMVIFLTCDFDQCSPSSKKKCIFRVSRCHLFVK